MINRKVSYEGLVEQARAGKKMSPEILRSIREQLRSGVFETDPYTLIHLLGLAGDVASWDLIRGYLSFKKGDPDDAALVRRIAIQVIGRMWGLRESFSSVAFHAFRDESPYVQAVAATALGHLGSKYEELRPEAARLLLKGFSEKNPDEPEVWESFYSGMLELLDVPISNWPPQVGGLRDEDVKSEIVDRIRKIAEKADS